MNELLLLILFLLAIAFLLQIDLVWYIVYICLGVYAWSHWITPRALKHIILNRSYQDHAFLGERVPVSIAISNTSRIPVPWIQIIESVPVELRVGRLSGKTIKLSGRQSKMVNYEIQAKRRGYYRLGPSFFTVGDVFGLQENRAQLEPDYLTVYPRIIPMATLGLPSKLPFGTIQSNQRLYEDPARPVGVRGYQSGDSQRHINWKVSAHANDLLVKTFEPAISQETVILLNLNQNEYSSRFRVDGPEWAIVVAATLAAYLEGQRQSIGLATNGVDPLMYGRKQPLKFDKESGRLLTPIGEDDEISKSLKLGPNFPSVPSPILPSPGRAHLMKVLEQLARIEAEQTIPFWRWSQIACLNLSWGVTILAISPGGDEPTCQALHRLQRSGFNPVLLVTEPYVNFSQIRERSRLLGFRSYHVSARRDLHKLN